MAIVVDWAADLGHFLWYGRGRAPRGQALYCDCTVDTVGTPGAASRIVTLSQLDPPASDSPPRGVVRCVCLSDTHEHHTTVDVPDGDVLLLAGDLLTLNRHFSTSYSVRKVKAVARWLGTLPHRHKFIIAGNHDAVLEKLGRERVDEIFRGTAVYLEDSGATFAVSTKVGAPTMSIWGSPASRGSSKNDAFQSRYAERIAAIPRGVDIVLTHGPLRDVDALQTRLHVSGHIHNRHGVEQRYGGSTVAVNASIMGSGYAPTHLPIVVDLPVHT
jgi:hypothetical protein